MASPVSSQIPLVSVVMAAYNAEGTIADTIASILQQSFQDFELIVIDDASTDRTGDIVASYADARIALHVNDRNLNLPTCLNKAIRLSRGKFIARMDADDVMADNRLERQLGILALRPDIGVIGSHARNMTFRGRRKDINKRPQSSAEIKTMSFFTCPMIHPTVMIRRDVIPADGSLYDERFSRAQDMECWARLVHRTDFLNIPEPLLNYRHQSRKAQKGMKSDLKYFRGLIADRNLTFLIENPSAGDVTVFRALMGLEKASPRDVAHLAATLINANAVRKIYDAGLFEKEVAKRVYRYLSRNWSAENRILWKEFTGNSSSAMSRKALPLFAGWSYLFKRKK